MYYKKNVGHAQPGKKWAMQSKWYKEGEKCTKYFCNLEKRHYAEKIIPKLKIEKNVELTKIEDILNAQKQFYENLFRSKKPILIREHEEIFFDKQNPFLTFLDDIQKQTCEGEIDIHELLTALKGTKNNKTPGSDCQRNFTNSFGETYIHFYSGP